jgi:hypothetical protein
MFDAFLAAHCVADPISSAPLKTLKDRLWRVIPAPDHVAWGRTRIATELAARGYRVALVDRRMAVLGLRLLPTEVSVYG